MLYHTELSYLHLGESHIPTTEELAFISTLTISYYPEDMNSKLTHATKLVTRVLSSRMFRIYRNLS